MCTQEPPGFSHGEFQRIDTLDSALAMDKKVLIMLKKQKIDYKIIKPDEADKVAAIILESLPVFGAKIA